MTVKLLKRYSSRARVTSSNFFLLYVLWNYLSFECARKTFGLSHPMQVRILVLACAGELPILLLDFLECDVSQHGVSHHKCDGKP